MGGRYKKIVTKPLWYPAEIHKRVLSLDEWADEIAFRFAIKKDVDERRRLMGVDSYYHPDKYRDGEAERFVKGVQNKESRHGVSRLGMNMGEPIEAFTEWNGRLQWNAEYDFERGYLKPIMINLSYDNKTLIKQLISQIEQERMRFERYILGDGLRSTVYGKRLYTEEDTEAWFSQKLLDWIDFNLWSELIRVDYRKGDIPELINVSESSVRNTLNARAKEIFSVIGLLRLRASAKILREKSPVPGK